MISLSEEGELTIDEKMHMPSTWHNRLLERNPILERQKRKASIRCIKL
jgi:hypothetical protein